MTREKVGGSRQQDSLCGNETETKKETNSGACLNKIDIDIDTDLGTGGDDKILDYKNQSDSETEISKTSIESMKAFQDNFLKLALGLSVKTLATMKHIGHVVRMSVSRHRGRRFEPQQHQYVVYFSKTLSALIQSTQLWNDNQVDTTS